VPESKLSRILPDAEATAALGRSLAEIAPHPGVVYLRGELGAGKTTLVRGLLRALGHSPVVRSPTYGLLEVYALPALTVVHVDLYRLSSPAQVADLGLRDYLEAKTLLLIEWPEKGLGVVAPADVEFWFEYQGSGRRVTACAHSPTGAAWISRL
jgi:tRNA threonylcarbamoyladenosine biosynthesis protein TsaE